MTPLAIIRAARALCERDQTVCAHIAILRETPEHMWSKRPLRIFANAIGVDISHGSRAIWPVWDAASAAARAAAWERAEELAG